MKFHVASVVYVLRIPAEPIFDEGRELWAQCLPDGRQILISPEAPIDERRKLLMHELYHGWCFEGPRPKDEEERATLAATVSDAMMTDLEAQGGTLALKRLRPEAPSPVFVPDVQASSDSLRGGPDRMPCAGCDAVIMCGSIHSSAPELHGPTNRWRMRRWFECEACGVLQTWMEWTTEDGTPSGQYVAVPRPRLMYGAEAATWLAANRDAFATSG